MFSLIPVVPAGERRWGGIYWREPHGRGQRRLIAKLPVCFWRRTSYDAMSNTFVHGWCALMVGFDQAGLDHRGRLKRLYALWCQVGKQEFVRNG